MGFDMEAARDAIISSDGDLEMAATMLISAAACAVPAPPPAPMAAVAAAPVTPAPKVTVQQVQQPSVWHQGQSYSQQSAPRAAPRPPAAASMPAKLPTPAPAPAQMPPPRPAPPPAHRPAPVAAAPSPAAAMPAIKYNIGDEFVEDPAYLTMMSLFKTKRCKDGSTHDSRSCQFFHSAYDRRRNPYTVYYISEMCQYPDTCREGDACSMAHNMPEVRFFPSTRENLAPLLGRPVRTITRCPSPMKFPAFLYRRPTMG